CAGSSFRSFAVVASMLIGAACAGAQELVVENTFLTVQIDGKPFRLEALIVKRPDLDGKLPIALVTHGRHFSAERNAQRRAEDLRPQAGDFAWRGWLAVSVLRRGFGVSEGPEPKGPDCLTYDFRDYFERSADDLVAALAVIAQRPDADPSRVIAAGESTGGAT